MPDAVEHAQLRAGEEGVIRSDHPTGKSGSSVGHSTVVGTARRSAGAGARSASAAARVPAPARYQPMLAAKAPGRA